MSSVGLQYIYLKLKYIYIDSYVLYMETLNTHYYFCKAEFRHTFAHFLSNVAYRIIITRRD